MRHNKHNHVLGVKKEHREALLANLASSLVTHGKIETTLAKARALRPFIEKIITLAKKAYQAEVVEQKLHFRRLAIARVRDVDAVKLLFDTKVSDFLKRNGGYTRIYKLIPRRGDASKMAIIEMIKADDVGYKKSKKRRAKKTQKADVAIVAQSENVPGGPAPEVSQS